MIRLPSHWFQPIGWSEALFDLLESWPLLALLGQPLVVLLALADVIGHRVR